MAIPIEKLGPTAHALGILDLPKAQSIATMP